MVSTLSMISRWRGSSFPSTATGHFSRASGITVWFVNASVCATTPPTLSLHASTPIQQCILLLRYSSSYCQALPLPDCHSQAQQRRPFTGQIGISVSLSSAPMQRWHGTVRQLGIVRGCRGGVGGKGTCLVMSQAVSQSRPSWSMSRRMSSATAMVGCVSFIWKIAFCGSSPQSPACFSLNRASTSCTPTPAGSQHSQKHRRPFDSATPT